MRKYLAAAAAVVAFSAVLRSVNWLPLGQALVLSLLAAAGAVIVTCAVFTLALTRRRRAWWRSGQ